MSEHRKLVTEQFEIFSKRQRIWKDVICVVCLFLVAAVLGTGLWFVSYLNEWFQQVQSVEMKSFVLVCYAIVMQLFAIFVWNIVFPKVYGDYDRVSVAILFLVLFMLLGISCFIIFIIVSFSFWTEDLVSARALVPAFGCLLFFSFFFRICLHDC